MSASSTPVPLLDRQTLLNLLACHSTPGDEGEVRGLLEEAWKQAGLRVSRLGDSAVYATGRRMSRRPVLLITAHMDSPGFAVDAPPAIAARRETVRLTTLGYPAFVPDSTPGVLKTCGGKIPVIIRKRRRSNGTFDYRCEPSGLIRNFPLDLSPGDRVCFASNPVCRDNQIAAPFLDNRLGCWLLAELAADIAKWSGAFNVVLGATAAEEMGGFGAPVLAHHVQPDFVIVLDATYEAADQRVLRGGGPVLTLSDVSVLLSPARRNQLQTRFASWKIPLQMEVYNFSGTDARAFPHQGLTCPVLSLLVATTGNHTPTEEADLRDAEQLAAAIRCLATDRTVLKSLL